MVMKALQVGTSRISTPSKVNMLSLAALARWMVSTCWATTLSTSSSIRLNSSKQAQAPLHAKPCNPPGIIHCLCNGQYGRCVHWHAKDLQNPSCCMGQIVIFWTLLTLSMHSGVVNFVALLFVLSTAVSLLFCRIELYCLTQQKLVLSGRSTKWANGEGRHTLKNLPIAL